jgi:hypothetical protein
MKNSPLRRWSLNFSDNESRKVKVNMNGVEGMGIILTLQPGWSFQDFLSSASSKLDLHPSATSAFTEYGITFIIISF